MTSADGQPVVALLGTLDTKGAEFAWVRDTLVDLGASVQVIDVGIKDPAGFDRDVAVSNSAVAEAAGASLSELRDAQDRGRAVTTMGEGAAAVLADAHEVDAVLGLAGSGGSSIFAAPSCDLPLGLPKLLVSTMASGDVRPYVGSQRRHASCTRVVDVAGHQPGLPDGVRQRGRGRGAAWPRHTTRAAVSRRPDADRPLVAATMFGVTTPAVDARERGWPSWATRCSSSTRPGSGGRAMEALERPDWSPACWT